MVNITTKYLEQDLLNLDKFLKDKTITKAEYMQIALLLKIFRALTPADSPGVDYVK
jgi:hypothetical protein